MGFKHGGKYFQKKPVQISMFEDVFHPKIKDLQGSNESAKAYVYKCLILETYKRLRGE